MTQRFFYGLLTGLTALCLGFINAPPCFAQESSKDAELKMETGIYQPPGKNEEIRRRNGGSDDGTSRSVSRGSSRGVSRGSSRGASRGSSRGVSRFLTRGKLKISGVSEPETVSVIIPGGLAPLAPPHTGLAAGDQPVLWWFISDSWAEPIELTLNKSGMIDPVLETQIKGPFEKGIYKIDLAEYNVRLEPDVEYEWFLTIVPDPVERSADFMASATLKYIRPGDEFLKKLKTARQDDLYKVFAGEGYWYDAMDHLSGRIAAAPENSSLRAERSSLLKQVHLPLAAAYDVQ
jgi:hypothetical protein